MSSTVPAAIDGALFAAPPRCRQSRHDARPRRDLQAVDEGAVAAEIDVAEADGVLFPFLRREGQDGVGVKTDDGGGADVSPRTGEPDGEDGVGTSVPNWSSTRWRFTVRLPVSGDCWIKS